MTKNEQEIQGSSDDSKRRIVTAPVLVIADDFLRADTLRGDLEELGLKARILSTRDPVPDELQDYSFSLAIFNTGGLTDRERTLAADLRSRAPKMPVLVFHGAKRPDLSTEPGPFAGAVPVDRRGGFPACRAAIFAILGVAETDESGTTIRG